MDLWPKGGAQAEGLMHGFESRGIGIWRSSSRRRGEKWKKRKEVEAFGYVDGADANG